METSQLIAITVFSDFLGVSITLWLAFYILSHSETNRMALRMVVTLIALSIFFFNAFYSTSQGLLLNAGMTTFALAVTLLGLFHITHHLLPEGIQTKRIFLSRIFTLLTFIIPFILLANHNSLYFESIYIIKLGVQNPILLPGIIQLVIAIGIAANLIKILQVKYQIFDANFYISLGVSLLVIAYSSAGTLLPILLPRYIATFLILLSILILGYSITRYQALIQRKVIYQDLPFSTIAMIVIGYLFAQLAQSFDNSNYEIGLLVLLAIISHSAYSTGREYMTRILFKEERRFRKEIRKIIENIHDNPSLAEDLHTALNILCKNLKASGSFIALKNNENFEILSSINSVPIKSMINNSIVEISSVIPNTNTFSDPIDWLAPITIQGQQVGVMGIGPLDGHRTYSDDDLDWVEEVADQISILISSHSLYEKSVTSDKNLGQLKDYSTNNLLSNLEKRPKTELVKEVEFGFRNIHDLMGLGNSSLTNLIENETSGNHLEKGKKVQKLLTDTLEVLKPEGERPAEPIPKAWWHFVILHDAYLKDIPDREIMARLFVSEGTFYRTRRKAIRGIARALEESIQIQ